jgi:hypothetical protein
VDKAAHQHPPFNSQKMCCVWQYFTKEHYHIVSKGLGEPKLVFIDFGMVVCDGKEYNRTVRAQEYAQIDVLKAYPPGKWHPVAKHKLASLVVSPSWTVALKHFEIPWESSFHLCIAIQQQQ